MIKKFLQDCREANGISPENFKALMSFLGNIPSFGKEIRGDQMEKAPSVMSHMRNSRIFDN